MSPGAGRGRGPRTRCRGRRRPTRTAGSAMYRGRSLHMRQMRVSRSGRWQGSPVPARPSSCVRPPARTVRLGPDVAMVDGHVVREPRTLHGSGNLLTRLAKGRRQEVSGVVDRLERPEAVDDPDVEAAPEERPAALAPRAVLRKVAPQPGHVIATVIMQNEKAAVRPDDA